MSPPRVDVGIPTVGRSRYVIEAVESVLRQTLTDWRLVVSEDGPASDLAKTLAPYTRDERIVYRALGSRRGAVANMNRILEHGTAPYVSLLHDDDRWDPGYLERRVAFLEAHPECGFVFSGSAVIDGSGRWIADEQVPLPPGPNPIDDFLRRLVRRNLISTPTIMVRRSAYAAVGGFDPEFPTIYDYEMWIRLAARFPAGVLATCDADWRLHGSQVSYDPSHVRSTEYRRLLARIDRVAPQHLRPSRRVARHNLADRHMADAVNAGMRGDRRTAARHVASAVRSYPLSAFDPRVPATLAAAVLGGSGRWAVDRLMWLLRRRQLSIHREPR